MGGTLTDVLPIGITNVSYINSGVMITPTGGVSYTWLLADMLPSSTGIITITGNVDGNWGSEGMVTNTAVFASTSLHFISVEATAVVEINIPPTMDIVRFYDINEGQSITLTGIITDPGLMDSFVLAVDWGDGLTETINYPPGTINFQQPHPYPDDDPSGTPVDDYLITVSLYDSDGGFDQKTAYATVRNITPTVAIGSDATVFVGETITFTGTYTDPGLFDTFDLLWDWGDGTLITNSLVTSHFYSETGSYTVTLFVTDDDTFTGSDSLVVAVRVPESDLYINKEVFPGQVMPGDWLTYTIAFINNGPDVVDEVSITDIVPISLTNLSYSSSGVPLTEVGSVPYGWLVEDLAVGQVGSITITGQLTTAVSQEYLLWNTVMITGSNLDTAPNNNSDSIAVDVSIPNNLFLPFIAHDACRSSSTLADVILVIDASASMSLPTQAGGQTKLEAAQAAAAQFLNILPLPANQASIVSFNATAVLNAILTTNRQELLTALGMLTPFGTTRIDLALALARGELLGPRHMAAHDSIILLLTDGIPNGANVSTTLAEANAAKAAGITIYTIGLGTDIDEVLLKQIASSPDQFYFSPEMANLDSIYQQIADIIRCDN